MSGMSAMEYHRDIIGEKLYASRNYNNLKQTYEAPGANRAQMDWNLTLRQVRKPIELKGSASAPTISLHTAEIAEARQREPLAHEHPDGPYMGASETRGKYQNVGNTGHFLRGLVRVSSGTSGTIDWALNLRGGMHQNEFVGTTWRRHHARPHQSFDMMKENCNASNEAYMKSQITPQDRRPDRRSGALPCETIRDDPISFRRWPGCEGTQVGQWSHLIEDRRYGHKARRHIQQETTLRDDPTDPNGARIQDNRSDGCIVEMMGKKKWSDAEHHEYYAQRLPVGDPKLYHLANLRTLPQQDEENRALRMQKQGRTDVDIPETRVSRRERRQRLESH